MKYEILSPSRLQGYLSDLRTRDATALIPEQRQSVDLPISNPVRTFFFPCKYFFWVSSFLVSFFFLCVSMCEPLWGCIILHIISFSRIQQRVTWGECLDEERTGTGGCGQVTSGVDSVCTRYDMSYFFGLGWE